MNRKLTSLAIIFLMIFAFSTPSVFATGLKEGASSLLLPTTGQAMNDQLGQTKTKVMAGVEVAAVTTVAILGGVVGGPVVWVGLGPLLANHIWSATDAYKNAKYNKDPLVQEQMTEGQRMLELSRQRRYEREQAYRSDVRSRLDQAAIEDK
ncbi:MAG: hypothetical protein HYZ84_02240 [Candidatus Omnitrophica bacterium]|nr:hypothetical protein [Candidatus Omnitrophota bacterium]